MDVRVFPFPIHAVLVALPLVLLTGCTDPPDLDSSVDPALEAADYPALVPVDQLLGQSAPDPDADTQTADRLNARAAGLQSRARQLQRSDAIDADTRRRLNSDIETD